MQYSSSPKVSDPKVLDPDGSDPDGSTDAILKFQTAWQGHLNLEFQRRADKTILSQTFAQAPLKVQRPFYPEDPSICHVVALHTAGGIVGSDRLSLDLSLQPHSHALLTTAAATKVYRSDQHEAQQTIHLKLAEQTCLEWLPQETILFDQAHYRQTLRVDLAETAIWIGWDITRLGRSARGETFTTGTWRSHTEVWQGDRLLWIDPQAIQGGTSVMDSHHGLAGYPVIASFVMVGRAVDPDILDQIRANWNPNTQFDHDKFDHDKFEYDKFEIGVTRLRSGLLCRYRGTSVGEAKQELLRVWDLVRQTCCDRPACIPRVWQL
jgi:urease accessory protein